MINDALFYQPYEIIGGEKIISVMAYLNHSGIIMNLGNKIFNFIKVDDIFSWGYDD